MDRAAAPRVELAHDLLDCLTGQVQQPRRAAAAVPRLRERLLDHDLPHLASDLAQRAVTDVGCDERIELGRVGQCLLYRPGQLLERDRLGQIAAGSRLGEAKCLVGRCLAAHRDHRRRWPELDRFFDDGQSVAVRQHDVRDHDVRRVPQQREPLLDRAGFQHRSPPAARRPGDRGPQRLVVLDDQDAFRQREHRLPSARKVPRKAGKSVGLPRKETCIPERTELAQSRRRVTRQ